MMRQTLGLLAIGGLLTAMAGATAAPTAPAPDKTFMTKAAEGGNAEVALGRLASLRGASPAVKQFGQRMVADHSKANADLMHVASQQGVTLPKDIAPGAKPLMAKLSKLSGPAFDKAYTLAMVKDHEEDIAEFHKEASGGKDRPVAQFAARTLPTLQMHLQMIQKIAQQQGASR